MTEQDEPKPDKEEKPIVVPGLGLVEEGSKFAERLIVLIQEAENISVFNPVSGLRAYRRLMKTKRELRPEANELTSKILTAFTRPVNNVPMFAFGYLQSYANGQCTVAFIVVQAHWRGFSETLDKKAAFLVASFSVYLSTVSLLVSLLPFWLNP
jgi:hypothetical protein